jgi:hypothetical protein
MVSNVVFGALVDITLALRRHLGARAGGDLFMIKKGPVLRQPSAPWVNMPVEFYFWGHCWY